MIEGRRQSYLAALGLPVWASRQLLPGALPADTLVYVPYEDEAVAADYAVEFTAPVTVTTPAVREAAPAPRPVVRAAEPVAVAPPAPAASVASATIGGSAEFPRFSFWFKPLPSGWHLLIALGDVPDISGREHQLLEQIEAVLGGNASQAPTTFNWPLNNNPAIPRDAQSAREAVGAFLGRQRKPGARYLLLGQDLLPYMQSALVGEKLAVGGSLLQLLAEPLHKRTLWQSLSDALA